MNVLFSIAVRNLIQARRRTFFLALALSMVMVFLILLMGLSGGLTDNLIRSATTLSSGHVNVAGFFKARASDATPAVTDRARIRKLVEENTPGLDYVIDRARGWARIISPAGSLNAGLTGVDVREEARLLDALELAKESEYVEGGRDRIVGDGHGLIEEDAALVFAAQAERLGLRVGDQITISVETLKGTRNTGDFRVVAVARDIGFMSNWSVFVSKAGLRNLYRLDDDVTGAIQVYLEDIDDAPEVMGHLRGVLENAGYTLMEHDPRVFWMKFETVIGADWLGQQLDLTIWSDEISFLTWVLTAIDSVSFTLIGTLVVIIAIGIMNSLWMSVRERTTEVGTLRAIGMSKGRVLVMFLLEALVLGFVSTSIGAVFGVGLISFVDVLGFRIPDESVRMILLSDKLHLSVQPESVLLAVGVFTLIAGLSALWPAYRASRMQPITAIGHIG